MCSTCGCGSDEARLEGGTHAHRHGDGAPHTHGHEGESAPHHEPHHAHGTHDLECGPAAGLETPRTLTIEQDILAKNDGYAAQNRRAFEAQGNFALNLVSSPGAGKTALLVRTIGALAGRIDLAVIEGDQQTSRDAERIRAAGAPAVQINTGRACHLDAHMVAHAYSRLAPARGAIVMIENVGNLVCPAAFDLGEAHKVLVLSVTEGEDKPLKYPDMFRRASLLLLNKVDLLPHLEFDVERCLAYARRINPDLAVIRASARTGEGFPAWLDWLERGALRARAASRKSVAEPRAGERRSEAGTEGNPAR